MSISDGPANARLHERVAAKVSELTSTERRVAEYMAQNPDVVATGSASDLARATGTSDATVVRTARSLGYAGLPELRREVIDTVIGRRDPARVLGHRLGRLAENGNDLDRVIADSVAMLQELRVRIDPEQWAAAVEALSGASEVFSYGIGPAGCVAEYLTIMLNRIGVSSRSSTVTGFRLADDLLGITPGDTVVVFAPLRRFREVDVVLRHANSVDAKTIVATEALGLALADQSDTVLATPQTSTNTASETFASFLLAHALVLSVAARRDGSVATMQLLNELRSEVAGPNLDVGTSSSIT